MAKCSCASRPLRSLEDIEEKVSRIAKVANSKRKRHRLTAMFWVKSHAAALQSCRDELDWAMNLFNVTASSEMPYHVTY